MIPSIHYSEVDPEILRNEWANTETLIDEWDDPEMLRDESCSEATT